METSPNANASVPSLDLSWEAQKSKEDVLTFSVLNTARQAFNGTLATLTPEVHPSRRLRQDFTLTLASRTPLTLEAKFEDYDESLFLEVLQLVARGGQARRLEPGWAYKTTAQYLLYISPVSGVATLAPRARILDIQARLLNAVLLRTRGYEVPCLLNAALNPPSPGESSSMPRAGVGLGLLRSTIFQAYQLLFDNEGLYHFNLGESFLALKSHLQGRSLIAGYPLPSNALTWWAENKLMSKPYQEGLNMVRLEDLPQLLEQSPLVQNDMLSRAPIEPFGFKFFANSAEAQLCSGQPKLFPHVPGAYFSDTGHRFEVKTPILSSVRMRNNGRAITRQEAQRFSDEELMAALHPSALMGARRQAYVQQIARAEYGALAA